MIYRTHKLSISCQTKPAGINWGGVYYVPMPVSHADKELMRQINRLHLKHSFLGTRMLRDQLHFKIKKQTPAE